MICPGCKGEKVTHGFACPGFRPINIPCIRCKGEGTVPEEMLKWIEHGKKLHEARVALRRVMRVEAAKRGLKASEWSAIEQGLVYNLNQELPHAD